MFISCGQGTKKENASQNSEKKTKTLTTVEKNNEVEKVEFVKHQTYGILLNQNNRLFDENLKGFGAIYSRGFEKVQILEITKKMYNLENSSDNCEKAYFVKIKYDNKNCIIFGKEVFEINSKQLFDFHNSKGDKFSIFPVTNFAMGASDDDGLTGCDDYSILIIENKKDKTFGTIGYPEKTKSRNNKTLKEAVLFHDDGAEEKIYNVSTIKDTLIVGIKAIYQEGGGKYNLKASFKDNFSKSIITDKIYFEEE